jgi:hypothetical protein
MNKPVWVLTNDIEYYVCKYNRISTVAYRLYKEYLIAAFGRAFEISVPETAFVKVSSKHLPIDLGIPKKHFDQPCFGSKKLPGCNEVDKHNVDQIAKASNKKELQITLLKISFFDIWLANEDRSHNNFNLLFTVENGQYYLHAIDHEACFNHGILEERKLALLTLEDSLIYSELHSKLFAGKFSLKHTNIDALKENYYICVHRCKSELQEILSQVPQEWNIDIANEKIKLEKYVLTEEWFNDTWNNFIQILQLATK